MEIDNINLTCSKCKKKRANTEADAHKLFGINKYTNTWCKQCAECREKYNEYSKKHSDTHHKCEHGHFTRACAICAKRCEHGKYPRRCQKCRPDCVARLKCVHNLLKHGCRLCNLCVHNAHKKRCKQCIAKEYLISAGYFQCGAPNSIKDENN